MESNSALVSIIVPVYGTEKYLQACIDSIRKQSYPNIQILLVDDQSPDRCPEICDAYSHQDDRITVIHQHNKGVSGARNTGLEHASGEYIMFVDSDDILLPEAVEILLQDILQQKADIVSAIKCAVSIDGHITCPCSDKKLHVFTGMEPLLLSLAGDSNANSACAKLFKTAFLGDIRFDEENNINEDGFFLFQCYRKQPVLVQHNVAVYHYTTRENSASREAFSDKYLSMLYFCERKKELIAQHYPQYSEQAYNMEVRTNLQFLDVLCRTTDKKHKDLQRQCSQTVRRLYRYHKPINKHHKLLATIVAFGLYPLYKWAVRRKYYR